MSTLAEQLNRPVRRLWISCDESGIDGKQAYYGFGSLWMIDQARGRFAALISDLRRRHGFKEEGEFKWEKVKRQKLDFYVDAVDTFFRTTYLAFHCLLVRKASVTITNRDLARRVHLYHFLTNKVQRCIARNPTQEHRFRVWVDPIPSSYQKADEALEVIMNNALAKAVGHRAVEGVYTKDSHDAPSIQLCDLLLGSVVSSFNGHTTAEAKLTIGKLVASYLGWPDLRAATYAQERKFNIWYLQNGPSREVEARAVRLKHPLPSGIKGAL